MIDLSNYLDVCRVYWDVCRGAGPNESHLLATGKRSALNEVNQVNSPMMSRPQHIYYTTFRQYALQAGAGEKGGVK
jgi:hypothetical protein